MTTTTPFTVTARSHATIVDETAASALGYTFDDSDIESGDDFIQSTATAAGGHPTGERWIEAEATLPTGPLAWFSIVTSSECDDSNRWQIEQLWIVADDGTEHAAMFRPLTATPGSDYPVFAYQTRVPRSLNGEHLVDIEDDHGGDLTVKIRMTLEQLPGAVATGGDARLSYVAVTTEAMPDVSGAITIDYFSHEWDPGVNVTQNAVPMGERGWWPHAMHVEVAAGSVVAGEGWVTPVDGVLRYQLGRALPRGVEYTVTSTVHFGRYATYPLTVVDVVAVQAPGSANSETLTATVDGYGVDLAYTNQSEPRIECVTGIATSTRIVADGSWNEESGGGGGGWGFTDYPPLNSDLLYRGWHGDYSPAPTGGAFGEGEIHSITNATVTSIVYDGWLLTDASVVSPSHIPLIASAVAETREATTVQNAGALRSATQRGVMLEPQYALAVTVTSTDELRRLVDMLADTEMLLLRGPHGQRSWVQPSGPVRITSQAAQKSPTPPETGGATGELGEHAAAGFVATVTATLITDTTQAESV